MTHPAPRATAAPLAADHPDSAPGIDVFGSRLGCADAELRIAAMVWRREKIRFVRARNRIITSLVQPVLFLFVLGVGHTPLVGPTTGLDFTKFIFPWRG